MIRKFAIILLLLGSSSLGWAQFTTVTGTVTDPIGIPYAGGTITPVLVISGTPKFTATNLPYTPPIQTTGLSTAGSFTMQLADVTTLTPGGATWNFTVCSAVGTVLPAFGKGPICFGFGTNIPLAGIPISGAAQNISAQLNAVAPVLTFASAAGISGSGTLNTVPLWTAPTVLGNSIITQPSPNTVNVGVGGTPAAAFNVVATGQPITGTDALWTLNSGGGNSIYSGRIFSTTAPQGCSAAGVPSFSFPAPNSANSTLSCEGGAEIFVHTTTGNANATTMGMEVSNRSLAAEALTIGTLSQVILGASSTETRALEADAIGFNNSPTNALRGIVAYAQAGGVGTLPINDALTAQTNTPGATVTNDNTIHVLAPVATSGGSFTNHNGIKVDTQGTGFAIQTGTDPVKIGGTIIAAQGITYGLVVDAFSVGCSSQVSPACIGGTDGGRKISSIINSTAPVWCPFAAGAFPTGINVGCIIDARNPQVTADMVWQINPFHGPNRSVVLLLGEHTYVACAPIVSGQSGYMVFGVDGPAQIPSGTRIRPGAVADGCAGTFPNGASQLTFTWQHALYPAGTYAALYNDCGDPSTDSATAVTADCFGGELWHLQFDASSNDQNPTTVQPAANFLYYSVATEERGGLFDVSFKNCITACAFFDRNNQVGPPSPGGSGPVHFTMHDIAMTPRTDGSGDLLTDGIVAELNTTYISFTGQSGCTETTNPAASGVPTAYDLISAGVPTGAAVVTNTGNCTVIPTGCTLNSPLVGVATSCAVAGAAPNITTVTMTGGSGYPTAAVPGGGPLIERITIAGQDGTHRMRNGIWIEGDRDTEINHYHSERIGNPGTNPGSNGDTIRHGFGNAPYSGGTFIAVNTTSGIGGCVHQGVGGLSSDVGMMDITREISTGCVIVDDNVINPLTNTALSLNTADTPTHRRVAFYGGGGNSLAFGRPNALFPCAGVGTAASPSVVSCGAASAGAFSCATNATGATCTVNTTQVSSTNQVLINQVSNEGAHLGVTCNGTAANMFGAFVSSRSANVSFTVTLPAFITNPLCFTFQIVNN